MITAVDTCVFLDILTRDPEFLDASLEALDDAAARGALVVGETVYAELAAAFDGKRELLDSFLADSGVRLVVSDEDVLALAGLCWREYRRRGGSRRRILPDFQIGAHAVKMADRLLTRDSGFYSKRFPDSVVVSP